MTYRDRVERAVSDILQKGDQLVSVNISPEANAEMNPAYFVHRLHGAKKYIDKIGGVSASISASLKGKRVVQILAKSKSGGIPYEKTVF